MFLETRLEQLNQKHIHNPMYSAYYEHVFDLVVLGDFLHTFFIFIFICLHIYLFITSIIFVHF